MKDAFDRCLFYPALKEKWKVVFDLNVGIVEALKLNQRVLVALFIARRLREAATSEKAGAIRMVHAQFMELKAMGAGSRNSPTRSFPPQAMVRLGSATGDRSPPPPPPRQRQF